MKTDHTSYQRLHLLAVSNMQVHNTQTLKKGEVGMGEYPQKGTWKLQTGYTHLFCHLTTIYNTSLPNVIHLRYAFP